MDTEHLFNGEQPESRSVGFTDMEVASDGWSFEGLLSVYDAEADLGQFTESFARGAYRKVLASGDNVPMLYHHNDTLPVLATTRGGTLTLKDDAKGLRVKAELAQHYMGEAVRELVKRGDITGMSPGFVAGRGNSKIEKRNGRVHRTIVGLKKLLDVSPTWEPAYAGTTAELRSLRMAEQSATLTALRDLMADETKSEALTVMLADLIRGDAAGTITIGATESSQSTDGGSHQQPVGEAMQDATTDAGVAGDGTAQVVSEQEEQRSGVDTDLEVEFAARSRRLRMLGLSLP